MRRVPILAVLVASCLGLAGWLVPTPSTAVPPPGAPGCQVFPKNDVWHANISKLPVNKHSAQWLHSMAAGSTFLHPDFGPSGGFPYGIPYTTVGDSHPKVHVKFLSANESDPGPYPFGPDTPIEGGKNAGGDRHAIMIDRATCVLYELYDAHYRSGGRSTAGSGAIWNLSSNKLRPAGWTSADAAGLPIFPGLLRLDEVEKTGVVDHAIRFTAEHTRTRFIWPARHQAGESDNPALPPMGARFRLKASFPIGSYRRDTQVVLRAMKRYGLILADNGSNWYLQGAAQKGWPIGLLDQLKTIPASAFVAVDESCLRIAPNSGRARSGC
jgi:hypothetical protein